jgi:hypothetical protein
VTVDTATGTTLEVHAEGAVAGARARFVGWVQGELALIAASPFPSGARVGVTLAVDSRPSLFRIKVHRCRRQEDGTFALVGRPLDLRRETRNALDALARVVERS